MNVPPDSALELARWLANATDDEIRERWAGTIDALKEQIRLAGGPLDTKSLRDPNEVDSVELSRIRDAVRKALESQ